MCHLSYLYKNKTMKTILVPTDFSEAAFSAAVYAMELAKAFSCKVILFHAYHPPLPSTGAEYGLLPDLDMDKENIILLTNFKTELEKKVEDNLDVECVVKIGFAVDEIVSTIEENQVDLVVMGISGGGRISEFLLGSTATEVIQKTTVPTLIIPPNTVYENPSRLVFACDYKSEVSAKAIKSLKDFMHLFHAKLNVLNLEKPEEGVTFEKAVHGIQLEHELSSEVHTLHFLPNVADLADEINDFVDAHDSSMLVMIPHKHNLLHRIFKGSTTKHLAFHSHVPILTLHE